MRPFLSLLSPAGARGRLSILIWHRVLPTLDPIFPEEMHAARFDRTLDWVKNAFNVLPLPEAITRLKAGTLPSRALAITFDDGYEDNHSIAMPLLQKHGLSATFFIATGFLDGGRMWNDSVIETLRHVPAGVFDTAFGTYVLSDAISRRKAIDALIDQIKYLDFGPRQAAVDALAAQAGVQLPGNLMMTSAQLRSMYAAGMSIGAHTQSHPILAKLNLPEAREEISQGRAALEQCIDAPVTLFAYPNGRPQQDYRAEHVDLVRELGFNAAVSTAWGTSRIQDDVFQLRRFTPWDDSRGKFLVRMGLNLARTAAPVVVGT